MRSLAVDIETIVIGGGAVGLAVAKSLCEAGHEVMVFERHPHIGSETSSRNSEVIHAGIYYPPDSLRAQLCIEGKKKLYRFCEENGVAVNPCGKLLVATTEAEVPKLQALVKNAQKSGVTDLQIMAAEDARALEPELSCLAACLSPSSGVFDTHGYLQALEGHVTTRGGGVVKNAEVVSVERKAGRFCLGVQSGKDTISITCINLVNAAGLRATEVGKMLNYKTYQPPETYPAKGHYFQCRGRVPFRRLIYPMPSGAWLGIHLTLDYTGKAKFGPDLVWKDSVDYRFEDEDGTRKKLFEKEVRRYWPGLPEGSLSPDYVGVRPKIYREGQASSDFAIHGPDAHGIDNFVGLYGIESPGLTASLAIGEYVAGRFYG